jgi:hypothetical protein
MPLNTGSPPLDYRPSWTTRTRIDNPGEIEPDG